MKVQEPLLLSLAKQISAHAESITEYCETHDYPHASFEPDGAATLLPVTAPEYMQKAYHTLLDSIMQLNTLVTDVADFLPQQQIHYQYLTSLRWLVHFKIPSLIPLTGAVSYSVLSASANVPIANLKRVAAMAISNSFLRELSPGHLSHTRLSANFVTEPSLNDWLLFMTTASMPTALKLVEATPSLADPEDEAEPLTAYGLATETKRTFFEDLKADSEKARLFAGYMKSVGKGKGTSIEHLVRGFDWGSLREGATVVDVGGSTGHTSIAIARAHPTLRFVVQDTPTVITQAQAALSAVEADQSSEAIRNRISYQAHDFMTPQAEKGAEVYVLRAILHDWSDDHAVTILGHIADALAHGEQEVGSSGQQDTEHPPSRRLLIMDTVLSDTPRSVSLEEAALRARDLTMMEVFGSREREEEDWRKLIERVGKGLVINSLTRPTASTMSIIEVVVEST